MNKVLGFIKGNLIIVISVVLILALLPVGYVFSGKWNDGVRTKVKDAYDKEKRSLTSSGKVTYSLPAVLEGEQDVSESRAPNAAVTEFFKQAKAAREDQVKDVVARGTQFNQGDHVELVPGLLPDAGDSRNRQRLGRAMSEAIVGTNDQPSVYQRKLRRLNAGSPPSPEVMQQTLEQTKTQFEQEYRSSDAQGNITSEQQEEIKKRLSARRLGEYINRAKSLTFYCDPSAFVNGSPTGDTKTVGADKYSVVPAVNWPPSQVTETVAFTWLWDYWVISDVLDAAAWANTNAASGAMSIPEAPVKRIDLIRVSGLEVAASTADADPDSFGGRPPRGGKPDDAQQSQEAASFTGREGGTATSPFDLRQIDVVAVVASKDLPKFLDAFGKVNFMTVTDVDLQEVDVWEELRQGYYYGNDHVVRVSLKIESVWLRSWVSPLMPAPVRETLGVPAVQGDSEG
ncbi:MAG: hypothetical protein KDA29_02610 [Phycisphaerales bacterium]|nr:hypothetical protein [Phycisphaerales bacterium]